MLLLFKGGVSLEFFSGTELSILIYLFDIYLYEHGLIDIYFTLRVIVQYYLIYFVAQIIPTLVIGISFSLLHCPFDIPQA